MTSHQLRKKSYDGLDQRMTFLTISIHKITFWEEHLGCYIAVNLKDNKTQHTNHSTEEI